MPNLSLSFFENVINSISDPIFVKDEDHKFILVNDALCNFTGLSRELLYGKSDHDFFSKEEADVFREKDRIVFKTKEENVNEENITDANGDLHAIVTKKRVFDDEGKLYLVGVINDITEKKRLIEDYQNSNEMLQNYAHMSSHDLKAPLRTLMSFSQLSSNCKLVYENLDQEILCDKLRIKQLFQNLIANAIKFRKTDEDLVIKISASTEDESPSFFVKDNGVGFQNKYNKDIFKMFKKLHGQEEFQGSGLGLSICQQIVHQHGGEIWAESEVGAGSTISFTIAQTAQSDAQYA